MNKTVLKNFAISSRRELLERVELQARKLGITAESFQKANVESSDAVFIDGKQLSDTERIQRNKLIARVNEIGFDRVMEETAYTWFNRFIALRYMEVNDYLPTKVRVLSSINLDSAEPDMMKEAMSLDFELDKELIYELKMNNKTDELFKYLIKMHCNDLNKYMPFMFETIEDYTEILFPEGLLGTDSFVRQMTNLEVIPEDNWEKVEIIGWLYQYYISEENERVIQAKKRYKAEELPFATQLFTPEWIVRYMVQNTLGRYWIETHTEHRDLIQNWEFYLENPNPEADFEEKIAPYINKELNVEDIKCFDPAMGSGHILVYMFEVLYEVYSKCGYMEREIPRLIIEKNLYGLDIDDRAYQLASFSVVMKALQYNKRFLRSVEREGLTMNLASIQETNILTEEDIVYLAGGDSGREFEEIKAFIHQFQHAKTLGSLIKITQYYPLFLQERLDSIRNTPVTNLFDIEKKEKILSFSSTLCKQEFIMSQQYDVLVTNPPYLGSRYMNPTLTSFMNDYYTSVKSDTFSAFMQMSINKVKKGGHIGFLTPYVWMFRSSYKPLRKEILTNTTLSTLIQLEYNAFPEACVPVCTLTMRNNISNLSGEYIKLSEFPGSTNQVVKTKEAIENPEVNYRYTANSQNFIKVPDYIIAYWASESIANIFATEKRLINFASQKSRISTGDKDRFLRMWYEVKSNDFSFPNDFSDEKLETKKWFPYNKGGNFRRWYGNNEYVINYFNNGEELRSFPGYSKGDEDYYFLEGLTWSSVTIGPVSFRYSKRGFLSDQAGPFLNVENKEENFHYLLGLLNSKVAQVFLDILSPTIHYIWGPLSLTPIIVKEEYINQIKQLVNQNVELSVNDWNSVETSWDFKKNPLLNGKFIKTSYEKWEIDCLSEFNLLKANEEKLNQIFIEIYGLQDELTPEVKEKDITIRRAELERAINSFISYAIGCSFGRYSLDEEGLIFAGGEFDTSRYETFPVDDDNILPILSGAYFEVDIVTKFVDFVRLTFSEETLEENLIFVADAIGRKKNETARETLRRYFLNDFYKEHMQVYKKRPIYWLFTSGKEKAFNCLIYLHRYDKTTLSRIRTDYLHEVQIRMDAEKKDLLNIIEGDSKTREISDAKKELKALDKKIDELKAYDELLHHMADMQIEIDLDDGVVVNYEKFKGLVAKIK